MESLSLKNVQRAASIIKDVVSKTPLIRNAQKSKEFGANIYFKREDLQQVRSYKIRGAFHKISSLSDAELTNGVVCASAGNHAQGVALSCFHKKIKGVIFMPVLTPKQKLEQVKLFGGEHIETILVGDTFDDASKEARKYCEENNMHFIHPFDDIKVIEGQATIALEILEQSKEPIDYLFLPVGGGGLASGVSGMFKLLSPETKIIGVEPTGAPSMSVSMKNGVNTSLDKIDKFIDGAAVQKVGDLTFHFCSKYLTEMVAVDEGKVCQTILELYDKDAIVVEPAGALTVCVLDQFKEQIKGKNIVCLISGSNNDNKRTEEIKERALLYSGVKHYFIVRFPQKAGALKQFITEVLGPKDDITHFEYSKKNNRSTGPAVIGIELGGDETIDAIKSRMLKFNFHGEYLNDNPDLFQILIQ